MRHWAAARGLDYQARVAGWVVAIRCTTCREDVQTCLIGLRSGFEDGALHCIQKGTTLCIINSTLPHNL